MSRFPLIDALKKQPLSRTPIWMMRQAGRYLPEYRETRRVAGDFLSLCKNPKLACEVTLQPLRRYALDAAIIFSDILTIPDAMGLGLEFVEGDGPHFNKPLVQLENVEDISIPALVNNIDYLMEAISLTRQALPENMPLLGFSGSPWTLACYMVEGGASKHFSRMITQLYMNPENAHRLLNWLTEVIALYLQQQIQAGVQAIQIFDTWGGLLSPELYRDFSLFYIQKIVQILKHSHPDIPVILFAKSIHETTLFELAQTGADTLSVDWTIDLQKARQIVGDKVSLQGNLDPAVLLTTPEAIEKAVRSVLNAYGQGNGHVFNLGHGITPDVPPENVKIMIEAVHRISPDYH